MSGSPVFHIGFRHLSYVMDVDFEVVESSLDCFAVSRSGKSFEGEFSPVVYHGVVRKVLPSFVSGSAQQSSVFCLVFSHYFQVGALYLDAGVWVDLGFNYV